MERGLLILGHLLHLSIKLRSGSLVDTAFILKAACPDSLQNTQNASSINVSSKLWRVEADLHMALSSQIIYLRWPDSSNNLNQRHGVTKVTIMQVELRITLKMGNTLAIIYRGTTYDTMHVITFIYQKLTQVRAVLTRNAGDKCNFSHEVIT